MTSLQGQEDSSDKQIRQTWSIIPLTMQPAVEGTLTSCRHIWRGEIAKRLVNRSLENAEGWMCCCLKALVKNAGTFRPIHLGCRHMLWIIDWAVNWHHDIITGLRGQLRETDLQKLPVFILASINHSFMIVSRGYLQETDHWSSETVHVPQDTMTVSRGELHSRNWLWSARKTPPHTRTSVAKQNTWIG